MERCLNCAIIFRCENTFIDCSVFHWARKMALRKKILIHCITTPWWTGENARTVSAEDKWKNTLLRDEGPLSEIITVISVDENFKVNMHRQRVAHIDHRSHKRDFWRTFYSDKRPYACFFDCDSVFLFFALDFSTAELFKSSHSIANSQTRTLLFQTILLSMRLFFSVYFKCIALLRVW